MVAAGVTYECDGQLIEFYVFQEVKVVPAAVAGLNINVRLPKQVEAILGLN